MHPPLTDLEQFNLDHLLLFQKEAFLLSITETFMEIMLQQELSIDQVALRCNIPKEHMAQLFSHDKPWSDHLIATIAFALGHAPHLELRPMLTSKTTIPLTKDAP